jgi:CRP-like cAMP-binding protein
MSPLIHVANILYMVSFVLKDILWLRIVAVLGNLCVLVALSLEAVPVKEAVAWNVLFFLINVVRIKLLLLERRPVQLSRDEQRLHDLTFRALTPRELLKLVALGRYHDKGEGEIIVAAGKKLDAVMVILDGRAAVKKDGDVIVELGEGRFVGEMSFLTGEAPAADVEALAPTRLVTWPTASLKDFLAENADLRASMQHVIGTDLVSKLRLRSRQPGSARSP